MNARASDFSVIVSGLCATLLGIGIQRFAYSPLLPAMVQDGWLTPVAAGHLGSANFFGYLVGAATAPMIGRAIGLRRALRLAMVVTVLCLALCAVPRGFLWLLPWRTLAGIAGGVLMVLAGPAIQQTVAARLRGRAAGVMFAGVGLGAIAAAVIVPAMLPSGVSPTWLALAAAGLALSAVAYRGWPDIAAPAPLAMRHLGGGERRLLVAYGLAAIASTPHMLFLPDFIARGLGWGTTAGAMFWLVFGTGAAVGPAVMGALADRKGAAFAYQATIGLQLLAVLLPVVAIAWPVAAVPVLLLSSFTCGAGAIGLTALTIPAARLVSIDTAPAVWRIGTAAYGALQVLTGLVLAWLLTTRFSYGGMFVLGTAAALASLIVWRPFVVSDQRAREKNGDAA